MSLCAEVCPSVWKHVPVCGSMSLCVEAVPLCESMSLCVEACPSAWEHVFVSESMSLCVEACPCVEACCSELDGQQAPVSSSSSRAGKPAYGSSACADVAKLRNQCLPPLVQ
eukprot:1152695-Pelagomonas_calceolata.AAC.1